MLARSWPQLEQNCLSHSEMHSKDHVLSGNPNWFPCSPPPTSQRQNVSQRFPARNSGPIWTRIKTSGAGERAQWLRVLAVGVGDLAQWQSTCLASTRPWVQSSASGRSSAGGWGSTHNTQHCDNGNDVTTCPRMEPICLSRGPVDHPRPPDPHFCSQLPTVVRV